MAETVLAGGAPTHNGTANYSEDVLGAPYVARAIPLIEDGKPINATLVRRGTPQHTRAVLYVHGFSDYFFQTDFADHLSTAGELDFYALDLRRYGRSIADGDTPAAVADVHRYFEEISEAVAIMRQEGHTEVILLGHSTGGLITTLFAHHHPGAVDALILNSPWYDVNDTPLRRLTSAPLARAISLRKPEAVVSGLDSKYGTSLHVSTGGEWDFNLAWKPLEGFPVRAAWLATMRRAHREIADGVALQLPVLMCTSSRSGGVDGRGVTPAQISRTDIVLNVAHMWRQVPRLGPDVTLRTIPGGMHDLALSAPKAREDYKCAVLTWISQRFDSLDS